MASLKDVERVADDLENLVGQLRKEIQDSASFDKLTQLADEISEHADNAATTFSTVNDALMERISEITDAGKSAGSAAKTGSSRAKAR